MKECEDEDEERTSDIERKVCFIHSARLLQMADRNPRYRGRVRPPSAIPSLPPFRITCHTVLALCPPYLQAAVLLSLIEAYGLLDKMT